jgi:nucleoside-diphosphate-sugar epimerase
MRLKKLFKLCSKNIIPILGDGNVFFHMVYIDDLVDAFILAAENQAAIGETFIVGGSECCNLNRLLELIAKEFNITPLKIHLPAKPFQLMGTLCESLCIPLGVNPPIYRRRVDFFTKSRSFDISKAKKMLGFKPKVCLKEGINRTAKWYKKSGLL